MIGGAKGIGIGIDFGIPNQYCRATSKPYIEKDVLDSLRVVASAYGKSNNDADRSIVKNLVDASNPFIISNAAYEGMSGYNGYPVVFGANKTWANESNGYVTSITSNTIHITNVLTAGLSLLYSYVKYNGNLQNIKEIPPFKIEIKGLEGRSKFTYKYLATSDATKDTNLYLGNGTHELPKSFLPTEALINDAVVGFSISPIEEGVTNFLSDITIKVLPEYEGAFVTDGIDDLITSTKTVQEMLGGSNELTIVSMVHQVKDSANNVSFTNYIRGSANGYFRNIVNNYDKTGIYGYTSSDLMGLSVVNNILGDKNDYTSNGDNRDSIINGNFSVQGYSYNDGNNTGDFSSVAWYWTVIANKVLTSDEINQIIAYYNLDKYVEPTVYYDVAKQKLSNDTPDSDWYLKDFSKNGFDMSLFNFAKKGNSGIGKYEVDFTSWKKAHFTDEVNTSSSKIEITGTLTTNSILINTSSTPMYNVEIHSPNKSIVIYFQYDDGTGIKRISLVEGINELPSANESLFVTSDRLNSKGITITQIPFNADALYFDGVDDFGKAIGLPVYKDYTVIADRELFNVAGCVLSNDNPGAFIFETSSASTYSFGEATSSLTIPTDKQIRYQTKYSYNGQNISIGAVKEGTSNMWLGTIRDNDARFRSAAIYSLMTFPYSMSEFLIERQLKKHKLGTLYPDMVEFRPIVNSNVEWNTIEIWQADKPLYRPAIGTNETGTYLQKDSTIGIYVKPKGVDEVTKIVVNGTEYTNLKINSNGFYYVTLPITESPQKIDITIDEYIRYEDIIQPYPVFFEFYNENNELFTWGDKVKVGSTITRTKGVAYGNLLEDLYTITNPRLNGVQLAGAEHTVEKQMVFTCDATYIKGSNAPKCILSPSRLRIPNSSYKILGYIPDISGHGNHGIIHNSAYAEGSGVNADGSYQLDGVDDFITIPTTVGGKQVLMKVNWQSSIGQGMLYDQRGTAFAIWNSDKYNDDETDTIPAYSARNGGNTYIDGILNKNILASQLRNITHNIVATNTMLNRSSVSPTIGCRTEHDAYFTNMSLYDFMLFDEIDSDEEILTLNEYVGIEGNTDDLFTENN